MALEWVERINPKGTLFQGQSYLTAKRIMDVSIVVLSFPISLPVMAICALLVKLEHPNGKIVFKQLRTGKGGRRFYMYKFRSMVPNAEEMKKELAHLNELQWPDFKITNDPRITKIGKVLRKTSLDELPQLFNILKGEMSLVGPRPTSFDSKTYALWHTERLDVLPGLTGLWQISGRGETEFDQRLTMDIAYIQHRCLWLDIQILFRTVFAVFSARGAH